MSTPPAAPAPTWRRRRRLLIPWLLLALLVGTGVVLYVRGTWADDTPRNPTSAAEGPVSQLYQPPGQTKRVRCAILLPFAPDKVWDAVTDYPHYGDFLPYISGVSGGRSGDGGLVSGQARSVLGGDWPFTIKVHEEKKVDGSRLAHWDETSTGEVRVNRGSWEVIPKDGQTLLVLSLEGEVHNYPAFVLRNTFLHRLKAVLRRVERHLQDQAAPK